MDRIVVSGLDSGGGNNQEFLLSTRAIQAIISGELLKQDNAAKVGTESAHTHTENTAATYAQNATTEAGSAHQHAYTNPVYSKVDLDVKDTWPGAPDSGDIMLVTPTEIKVYDDLDIEDILIMVVTYEGSFIRA